MTVAGKQTSASNLTAANSQSALLPYREYGTKPTSYDYYSAWLKASIVLLAMAVALLFVMWFTSLDWSVTLEVKIAPMSLSPDQNPEGIAEDFEEPGVEELADVTEPQLADAVEALTSDPSSQRAALEAVNGNKNKAGPGKGLGDNRTVGPGTGGEGGGPMERWDIRYSTTDKTEYFRQLDFFNIELAAVSTDSDLISYASNLSIAKPKLRKGKRSEEKRLNFRYREGYKLQLWDIEKLEAAGIDPKRKILLQFYANETAAKLGGLEQAKIGNVDVKTVQTTSFGVRAKGNGFEYHVVDVKFK